MKASSKPQVESFTIKVDYTKLLADMVAAGKYDYANEYIVAKNFPIEGTCSVETELVLVHFDRAIQSDDVVKEMKQMRLRPATLPELLALGAKYPDLQREYPIVALGSSWVGSGGRRRVPCLDYWSARRYLYLRWFGPGWDRCCRFAAVRK